jgi:hypothetical protein
MRETIDLKAARYLGEGRLLVWRVDSTAIEATCRGGGAIYDLGHDGDRWHCTCPARTRCAHVVALQLVTARPA